MLKTQQEILSGYTQTINDLTSQISQTKKRIDQLSFMRIGLFLAEILFFVLLLNSADDIWRPVIYFALMLPVVGFIIIVRKQSALDREVDYRKQLLWVYQNESNLMNGLENGYDHGSNFGSEQHIYTSDLDIFGRSSLFAKVNRCYSKNGNALLARNLAAANPVAVISQRQEAVKELVEQIEETFAFRANLHGHDIEKIEQIKQQLKSQLGEQLLFTRSKFLKFYVLLAPFISISLILLGLLVSDVYWKFLTAFFIINTGWNILINSKVTKVFYCFGGGFTLLNDYASAIRWTEHQNWKSAYILNLFTSKIQVSKRIKDLSVIIKNFDARLNILVGGILNALFMWDLRCCISLDRWHQNSSYDVIAALNRIGDFEELISFATLTYNQPDWVFPVVSEKFKLEGKAIGHPLIADKLRVSNDFNLEEQPTVDIVTGSNMAGKSTFLRTLGINMVLAYAGAPVCAKEMTLSVFVINTYMRIIDSLNESTSTFKAELNRLKMILDNIVRDKTTFVLIDEMLRGTNSRDKYLGSKVFVEKLIAEKTPALFATHDLQLADLKETHPDTLRNFHFDIQIMEGEMKFDYKLKQGPCKTFNAAILLKEIGLTLN
ncbi:MutS-related protein [Pedobacter punctiformis]|uniref:DNA mismatch repair protein MutS n=1 Tax=Pedobacter punctiformis TaxID=3004097 RepID=A0ABT4L3L3_9SPHI|nr:DNA mismatch repair protein MutS [Pedobacter sp. HCMS5-2]MCZ4242509.1 DNA mismatch repair protein MutS [Pedobacter sp. HCMS5-2]